MPLDLLVLLCFIGMIISALCCPTGCGGSDVGAELTGYIVSAIIALLAAIYLIIALVAPERF